jgi:DNA-binding beta-propeller fold protein YncE
MGNLRRELAMILRARAFVASTAFLPLLVGLGSCSPGQDGEPPGYAPPDPGTVPDFEVDPAWPRPLPNQWILGQVAGVAVDPQDHVWIIHRPGSLTPQEIGAALDPPTAECCVPAPPVIEFDANGDVVQAWGGSDSQGPWPETEHGIYVDGDDHVWIGSSGAGDQVVLKFSRSGERLLQIGMFGQTGGSNDTTLLGRPTDFAVDPGAREVYVTDGYGNRRVIVFDSETGDYKRHWGAYGEPPEDGDLGAYDPAAPPARSFRSPVHAVALSRDGGVYVADRVNDRIQVFRKDGTFLEEAFIRPATLSMGSAWDMALSPDPDQAWLYLADGTNNKIWILSREGLEVVGELGRSGRYAGEFHWVHSLAVDSRGNLYTAEVDTGQRVQRFRPVQ